MSQLLLANIQSSFCAFCSVPGNTSTTKAVTSSCACFRRSNVDHAILSPGGFYIRLCHHVAVGNLFSLAFVRDTEFSVKYHKVTMLFSYVFKRRPAPRVSPSSQQQAARPFSVQLTREFLSDGYVDGVLSRFIVVKRWITARSSKFSSIINSVFTSAVTSHISPAFVFRHHEVFMSSHIVTTLEFKGPSLEPQGTVPKL